jgi:hypothetical protein
LIFTKCSVGIPFPALKNDFWVRVYLATTPVVSGSGTLGITSIQLQLEQTEYPSKDKAEIINKFASSNVQIHYLDTLRENFPNQTLTIATDNRLKLEAIEGDVSWMLMQIKATSQAFSTSVNSTGQVGTFFRTQHLGDTYNGATIAIENANRQVIDSQNATNPDYIQQQWACKNLPGRFTDMFRSWYLIPFGDMYRAETRVGKFGYGSFDQLEYCNIKPMASNVAETAELYTLTPINSGTHAALSPTGTTNAWSISWNGKTTTPLDYNASLATIQAAVEALTSETVGFDGTPIRIAVGGALFSAATTGLTLSFSNLPWVPSVKGLVPFVNSYALDNGTIGVRIVTTLTTAGVVQNGLATGSKDITFWARVFATMNLNKGRFETRALRVR